jgi:hypothetical protein
MASSAARLAWLTDRHTVCAHRWPAVGDEPCTASVVGEHVCSRTSPEHRSHHCVCGAILRPIGRAATDHG